jgi:hypothetical protein
MKNKKTFQRIINFMLAIIMVITIIPVSVYGDGEGVTTNVNGSGSGKAGNEAGGFSRHHTGYIAYIVDESGNLVTDVVLLSLDKNGDSSYVSFTDASLATYNTSQLKSRLGDQKYSRLSAGWSLPAPSDENCDSNADAVRAWVNTECKPGITNLEVLIWKVWDYSYPTLSAATKSSSSVYYKFFEGSENLYFILEAAYRMNGGDKDYVATSRGWAQLIKDGTIGYGDQEKAIRQRFPSWITFDKTQFGLTPAPGGYKLEINDIINTYASGMASFWNKDNGNTNSSQTTADESLVPKPHKAPDESEGTYKIVKNYVTRTKDTTTGEVTYTDDGCYTKTEVTNEISIEDEKTEASTSYSLRNWKVTDSSVESVTSVTDNSLVWSQNVPGNEKSSGTDPATVDVKKLGGETVYLLLIRDKTETSEVPDEISFEISQSSLTKRVRFSESSRTQVLGNNTFQWHST